MRDLSGKLVVVTRPADQSAQMCRLLERHDARPVLFPTVEIVTFDENPALDRALREWGAFDWVIFTSVNGVTVFYDAAEMKRFDVLQTNDGPRIAAIGPATAAAVERMGGVVQCVPSEYVAEAVGDAMGEVHGQRILLPRARQARRALSDQLAERGATVVDVATYDAVVPSPPPDSSALLSGNVDVLTFTSSSTVHGFMELLGDRARALLEASCVACIGPITAASARRAGARVDVIATDYTVDGLVEALIDHYNG